MEDEKILDMRIGYQLKRAQHALRLEMDAELRDLGLTTPQYSALSVLGDEPGLSGAALAQRCFVTSQTMNQILVKLESVGFVERRPHPEHGRILSAYLTKKGTKRVSKADGVVETIEDRMLAGLGRKKRSRLQDALISCTQALENSEAKEPTKKAKNRRLPESGEPSRTITCVRLRRGHFRLEGKLVTGEVHDDGVVGVELTADYAA